MNFFVHKSSYVDDNVVIGEGTKIWHFCHIQSNTTIGDYCTLGQNVNISNNVNIGDYVKIQNNVSVYEGVELEDYVFCGPSMVFTNDINPRSEYPKGSTNYKKTLVKKGATIGANATILCGNKLGEYSMIGSGAVVTKDVASYALMIGVPAKQVGWVCQCGQKLCDKKSDIDNKNNISYICKECGKRYILLSKYKLKYMG